MVAGMGEADPSVQKYLQMENQAGAKMGLKPYPVHAPVHAADVLKDGGAAEVSGGQR